MQHFFRLIFIEFYFIETLEIYIENLHENATVKSRLSCHWTRNERIHFENTHGFLCLFEFTKMIPLIAMRRICAANYQMRLWVKQWSFLKRNLKCTFTIRALLLLPPLKMCFYFCAKTSMMELIFGLEKALISVTMVLHRRCYLPISGP